MRLVLDSDVLVHALRALWYVAWKRGIRSYWLQGLRNEHVLRIINDEEVVDPER